MEESILVSIKKLLGLAEDYTAFDVDLVMHINSVIMVLRQIGIGPANGYFITGSTETWKDLLTTDKDVTKYAAIKSYIFLKVRQLFDPTMNGAVTESTNNLLQELEYRLYFESNWPTIT